MKLTREQQPEALKRFRHLEPARWGAERCGRRLGRSKRTCTLRKGHRGPHAAHGLFGRLQAVWEGGGASAGAAAGARMSEGGRTSKGAGGSPERGRRVGPRRPVGVRRREEGGALAGLKAVGAWIGDHAEEILLLTFFVAFVWFAVDWLMIIFR